MAADSIRRVAVIGTGTIGASWTALFLARGLTVAASDPACVSALTAKDIDEFATIEVDGELAVLHVDARHDAEVAVVDLFVVIVLDLHDLVARAEGPAKTLDADLAGRGSAPSAARY